MTKKPTSIATDFIESTPRRYHHGNLRQELIESALALAEEKGPEGVSVREAARRLGVSPAAPFRHFPNRRALMTAVAEDAALRLRIEVNKSVGGRTGGKGAALEKLRSIGRGYLKWAISYPSHFRIISARDQIDLEHSAAMHHNISDVRAQTIQMLQDAQSKRQVSARYNAEMLALLARATVYGLARMHLDGHLSQWNVAQGEEAKIMQSTLDLLVDLMAATASA
jgi:AcrR family transcriptional regulator